MKMIIAIDLLMKLLDTDLPKMVRETGTTLHYPDLYKGRLLSHNTQQRLRDSRLKDCLFEIPCSEKDMLRYHQELLACEQHLCLTIEDYVAVAYAKEEDGVLLAEKGWLSRFALSRGVEVMSLKELEDFCQRRRRQDRRRKESLRKRLAPTENEKQEIEHKHSIDDDTSF